MNQADSHRTPAYDESLLQLQHQVEREEAWSAYEYWSRRGCELSGWSRKDKRDARTHQHAAALRLQRMGEPVPLVVPQQPVGVSQGLRNEGERIIFWGLFALLALVVCGGLLGTVLGKGDAMVDLIPMVMLPVVTLFSMVLGIVMARD